MLPQIPVVRIADAQKLPLPTYADGIGTSMILRSAEAKSVKIAPQHYEIFSTGLAIALPVGMEAQIRSLKESTQNGIIVLNAPVTIDASDRAEIKVCVYNASSESVIIKPYDPIALMVFALVLRVDWHDLTPQIVEKIHLTQAKNEQEIVLKEERKKQADEIVASMIIENTPEETNEESTSADVLSDENTFNEVTAPEQETRPTETPSIIEDVAGIPEEKIEEEKSVITPVEIIEETHEETESVMPPSIPETVINEPIAPPAILAEFEKIENDFVPYQKTEESS
jgi:dUTP pyrophosphatase